MRRLPIIALISVAAAFIGLLSCGDPPPVCLPACAKDEVCIETKEQIGKITKQTYSCEMRSKLLVDGGDGGEVEGGTTG